MGRPEDVCVADPAAITMRAVRRRGATRCRAHLGGGLHTRPRSRRLRPAMQGEFTTDFSEDLRELLIAALARLGSPIDPASPLDHAAMTYFNLDRRRIRPTPRTVRMSRELAVKTLPAPIDAAVTEITRRAEHGEPLVPFLSKQIADAHFADGLLNDWGIHHLHVGSATPGADGYVKQQGELLYAWVLEAEFLMLDVRDHHSFADDALVAIMVANWPEKMARFRMASIRPSPNPPTPGERKKARQRVTMFTQGPDGAMYMPPGGGCATSGISIVAVDRADRLCNRVDELEQWTRTAGEAQLRAWVDSLPRQDRVARVRLLVGEDGRAWFVHAESREIAATGVDLLGSGWRAP